MSGIPDGLAAFCKAERTCSRCGASGDLKSAKITSGPSPSGSTLDEIDMEPVSDARACGAAGCRTRTQLLRGVIDGVGQRVLCPEHMARLLRREVLNDD